MEWQQLNRCGEHVCLCGSSRRHPVSYFPVIPNQDKPEAEFCRNTWDLTLRT